VNQRLVAIQAKRSRLLERAAREREDVAQTLQLWSQPLGFVDRCLGALRYVISSPLLVAGAVLVFTLVRPLRTLKWAQRAWGVWQGYRWLTQKVAS
jgi:YqjK-like protein